MRLIPTIRHWLFGKLLPKIPYPVVKGPLRGAWFVLGSLAGEGGGASVYFNRIEPEQTHIFKNSVGAGQVVFDIGANVGYYTILAARLVGPRGQVIAFEPAVRNLHFLYRHVAANQAHNVMIVPVACSDTLSVRTFARGENYAMGQLQPDGANGGPAVGEHPLTLVPTVTVDAVVERLHLSPNIVKIDVEGAELAVLKGMQTTLREAKPTLFLSVHSQELRQNCLKYLVDRGYATEALDRNETDPREFLARFKNN